MPSPSNRLLRISSVLALAAGLGGCSGYLDHNDTVSPSAGDAVDANIAIQTIDPWPLASSKTDILSDGYGAKAAGGAAASAPAGAAAAPAAAQATPVSTLQNEPSE